MPSNDKLYQIFEKYNLNSQSVKSVETKKHANINEVYQNYKISKYNFIHKNSYKANISEVVFGNVFKGTVYLNQDDILFLRQFDPYYWKQALFMRYDKYLFEYLKRLHNLRKNEYDEVWMGVDNVENSYFGEKLAGDINIDIQLENKNVGLVLVK